jgi:hypothetical protein
MARSAGVLGGWGASGPLTGSVVARLSLPTRLIARTFHRTLFEGTPAGGSNRQRPEEAKATGAKIPEPGHP